MEDNTNPGVQPIQPATPAPEQPEKPFQIPVNDSTVEPATPAMPAEPVSPVEPIAPVVEPVAPNIIATEPTPAMPEADASDFATENPPLDTELVQNMHESSAIMPDQTPKKSRTLIVLIIIFLLALVGAGAVFAYFALNQPTTKPAGNNTDNSKTDNGNNNNNNGTPVNPVDPTPDTKTFTPEGTAITDSEVISKLINKTTILTAGHQGDDTFLIWNGMLNNVIFNGSLTDGESFCNIASAIDAEQSRSLTDEEVDTIEQEDNVSLVLYSEKTGIDGSAVSDVYKELFGKEPETLAITKDECHRYAYNQTTDVFYNLPVYGGGDYRGYYNITDLTEDGDKAYVYLQAASVMYGLSDRAIYCDVYDARIDSLEDVSTCATVTEEPNTSEVVFGTTADYTRYRITFTKSEDGDYYFSKVEKIQHILYNIGIWLPVVAQTLVF